MPRSMSRPAWWPPAASHAFRNKDPIPLPANADIDELANPLQAALVSAVCFTVGAALPLLSAAFITDANLRLAILAGATTREQTGCAGH